MEARIFLLLLLINHLHQQAIHFIGLVILVTGVMDHMGHFRAEVHRLWQHREH